MDYTALSRRIPRGKKREGTFVSCRARFAVRTGLFFLYGLTSSCYLTNFSAKSISYRIVKNTTAREVVADRMRAWC